MLSSQKVDMYMMSSYSTYFLLRRLCMEREQERYRKNNTGHISKVKHYGNSSTCTMKEHLRQEHAVRINTDEHDDDNAEAERIEMEGSKSVKQQKLSFEKKLSNFQPYSSDYELNRDFAIWAAVDIQPFSFTGHQGMAYFFHKNFPLVKLPSRDTVARTGLFDVYDAVLTKLKSELRQVQQFVLCLMAGQTFTRNIHIWAYVWRT